MSGRDDLREQVARAIREAPLRATGAGSAIDPTLPMTDGDLLRADAALSVMAARVAAAWQAGRDAAAAAAWGYPDENGGGLAAQFAAEGIAAVIEALPVPGADALAGAIQRAMAVEREASAERIATLLRNTLAVGEADMMGAPDAAALAMVRVLLDVLPAAIRARGQA